MLPVGCGARLALGSNLNVKCFCAGRREVPSESRIEIERIDKLNSEKLVKRVTNTSLAASVQFYLSPDC